MKSQETAIYREIQRNTDMAIKAIDTISDKVYDDSLALEMSRQSIKYSEIHNEALRQLVKAKAEPYRDNYISDFMLKAGIHYNTLLNTNTGHVAELMIKGSNTGILELEKVLRHNQDAGEESLGLAKQLMDFEEQNVKKLKDYL